MRTDDGVRVLDGDRIRLQTGAAENIERDQALTLLQTFGKQQITFGHNRFPFLS